MDHGGRPSDSIETRASWVVAGVALTVLTISYGAPLITVVALKPIAAEFGTTRSAPALAVSLTYVGSGMGGIAMGWLAGRIGIRRAAHGDRPPAAGVRRALPGPDRPVRPAACRAARAYELNFRNRFPNL